MQESIEPEISADMQAKRWRISSLLLSAFPPSSYTGGKRLISLFLSTESTPHLEKTLAQPRRRGEGTWAFDLR